MRVPLWTFLYIILPSELSMLLLRVLPARCFWPVLPLLAISLLGSQSATGQPFDPVRFERTVVQTELVQPMEFEIAPDGRIFVIELGGNLKLLDPRAGTQQVVGQLKVTTEQENGLIGLALDPKFAENGWIYLQYSPPDFSGQFISRFDFRDNQLDLSSEKRLFSYEEQRRECCHHAGSLEFGPDGNLYIGTGDNTNPFNDSEGYAPIDQRENREPWDAQRTAGNTKSYNGKVLRIRPEADGTYSIPPGNLFPADGSIGHPEIYVMGCRNPWRISVDQKTGYLYWGDVGPDAGGDGPRGPRGYDEINQARQAGNFGWPYFIGDNFPYSMVNFATGEIGQPFDPAKPLNQSVNNTGASELPPAQPAFIYYPGGPIDKFPEVGSGGRTACAGPVYYFDAQSNAPNRFPVEYDRTLFAFEWSRNWILAVHMDEDSQITRLERFLPEMKFTRPIDLQFGSDGALYVLEYGETWGVNTDSQLVRIDYVRGNRTPVAVAKVDQAVGREPLTVQLNGEESRDKDRDPLSYRWTYVRGNDVEQQRVVIAESALATAQFADPGVYTVELEVRDPAGASHRSSLPVIVGNARPEIEILSPQDGDFFDPSQPLEYQVVVRDHEDGTNDTELLEEGDWQLIESLAPSRVMVEVIPAANSDASSDHPGLALMRQSDCFNCHAAARRLVGPAFIEIADKYRNDPHQLEMSVKRVREGSTGVWGKIGMLPHQQHTASEVTQMVEYVYSVTAGNTNPNAMGFNNSIELGELSADEITVEARYTDLGRDDIPKLEGVHSIRLRGRTLQAESANRYSDTQPLGSDRAAGKRFMGAINHNGFLQFDNIRFDNLQQVTVRVASAGAGGTIELRIDSADGDLLGSLPVAVNGDWEDFRSETIPLKAVEGKHTLFVVFKNEANRGGLMNIDSLTFE